MDIVLSIAAILLIIVGIVGCIVPVLPGVALSYAGLLCASFCSYSTLTPAQLWTWAAITIAVSVADYLLPGFFTRLVGGTRAGSIGATVGMVAGFFFGGIVGVILGPFVGAVIGEFIHDSRDSARAFRSGFGSFLAFLVGTGLKLTAAVWMFCLVWVDIWPVMETWFTTIF